MKKILFFLCSMLLPLFGNAQINFEKGYFITNTNQKIECLIKNIDWKNNPTQFTYKRSETREPDVVTIASVQEFAIDNSAKYIRATVNIDRSSEITRELSPLKQPVFKEETLFLKVLLEGKASLYKYEDGNLQRYFFSQDNGDIEQLIFKKFITADTKISSNEAFKQQLWTHLKCSTISINNVNATRYAHKSLFNLLMRYNQCIGAPFINFENKQQQDLLNITLRPGIRSTSLAINNRTTNLFDVSFDDALHLSLGIEFELIMPFNKNKWAVVIEPMYQSYTAQQTKAVNAFSLVQSQDIIFDAKYTSIELPVSIRHYFFLNKKDKLFVNGGVVFDLIGNNSTIRVGGTTLDLKALNNFAFGLGYKHDNTYSIEFRYFTNKDLFVNYRFWESDYKALSLIFGYTLF